MSAPPMGPPPPDTDRSAGLLASLWVPFPFTVVLLAARLYVRTKRRSLGWDDWFMVIGWVLYVVGLAITTDIIDLGGVLHIEYVNPANLPTIAKLEYVNQPFGIMSVTFAKCAVALLLLRLLDATSFYRKWYLLASIVVYFAISISSIAVLYAQCSPTRALWEPQLLATGQATCWNHEIYTDVSILQGAFGAYLDFALALLPISIVWNLKMDLKKKIALALLLSLGIFAGVCASIKTAQFSVAIDTSDPTYGSYTLYLWASLEIPFVIIGGCVPAAKPLWDRLISGKPLEPTKGSTTGGSSTGRSYKLFRSKGKSGASKSDLESSGTETARSTRYKSTGSRFTNTNTTDSAALESRSYDDSQWGGPQMSAVDADMQPPRSPRMNV